MYFKKKSFSIVSTRVIYINKYKPMNKYSAKIIITCVKHKREKDIQQIAIKPLKSKDMKRKRSF